MGPGVEFGGTLAQPFRRLGIAALDLLGLEGDEGVGILREAGGNRFGQRRMPGLPGEDGFRQFQMKGRRIAQQFQIVLAALTLPGQFVGQAADDQLAR